MIFSSLTFALKQPAQSITTQWSQPQQTKEGGRGTIGPTGVDNRAHWGRQDFGHLLGAASPDCWANIATVLTRQWDSHRYSCQDWSGLHTSPMMKGAVSERADHVWVCVNVCRVVGSGHLYDVMLSSRCHWPAVILLPGQSRDRSRGIVCLFRIKYSNDRSKAADSSVNIDKHGRRGKQNSITSLSTCTYDRK